MGGSKMKSMRRREEEREDVEELGGRLWGRRNTLVSPRLCPPCQAGLQVCAQDNAGPWEGSVSRGARGGPGGESTLIYPHRSAGMFCFGPRGL